MRIVGQRLANLRLSVPGASQQQVRPCKVEVEGEAARAGRLCLEKPMHASLMRPQSNSTDARANSRSASCGRCASAPWTLISAAPYWPSDDSA